MLNVGLYGRIAVYRLMILFLLAIYAIWEFALKLNKEDRK
jgi:hypothetical protein